MVVSKDNGTLRQRALSRLQGMLPMANPIDNSGHHQNHGLSPYEHQQQLEEGQDVYGLLSMEAQAAQNTALARNTMITIRFQVHYQTMLGQELLIGGSHDALGRWNADRAISMMWTPGDIWMAEVQLPAGSVCFYKYLLAEGNSMEWQKGANHVLALPTEEHHVADRVYEATDLWSGEPTASSSAWQELLVRRIEEADELRKLAESDSAKNRAMAEAALTELITAREEAAQAWGLLKENGVLPPAGEQPRFNGNGNGNFPPRLR